MLVHIDPADARPLYLQIMDEVRRALVVGTIAAEDPLPSVRELAAELRVNPRTVSQAYRELEREGVVYVRRGQGTFVAPGVQRDRDTRRALALGVAKRALLEARRNGLGVEALVDAIREVAAGEGKPSPAGLVPNARDVAPDSGGMDPNPAGTAAVDTAPGPAGVARTAAELASTEADAASKSADAAADPAGTAPDPPNPAPNPGAQE